MQWPRNLRATIGVLTLAVLLWAAISAGVGTRVTKAVPLDESRAWPSDTFRAWSFFANAAEVPAGLETRGSRIDGRVEYVGDFISGWFRAEPSVTLLVSGFPKKTGNALTLEVRSAHELHSIKFDAVDPGDCWRPWRVALPPDAVSFRVRASDGSSGENGWLAVTEPFRNQFRADLLPQTQRTFLAFLIDALLLSVVGLASIKAASLFSTREVSPGLLTLLGAAAVGLLGYLAFWIYFAHPAAGRGFSWSILIVSSATLIFGAEKLGQTSRDRWRPLLLAGLIGVFYLSLLTLFDPPRLSVAAANRFDQGLPSDNEIPRAFAERLWKGESPRHLWGDWLSSDRPPLQAGWLLITWPILHALNVDLDTAANVSGLCFQLTWVPAVCALAATLGVTRRQCLAVAAAVACSGIFLEFSVFVWPKLGSAAFVVGAYLVWFDPSPGSERRRFAIGGLLAALGWLAHGGVAFSIMAIAPLAIANRRLIPFSRWMPAVVLFVLCAAPWLAYQHWYEPPGNRLLKWHLAGSMEIDSRTFLETIRASYHSAGFTALESKWGNLCMLFDGNWLSLARLDFPDGWLSLRATETTYLVRAWDWWILALTAPLIWLLRPELGPPPAVRRAMLQAAWWTGLGVLVWLTLIFLPRSATIHQGTLVTQLASFTLLVVSALHVSRWFFVTTAFIQAVWFLVAWLPPSIEVHGKLDSTAATIAILSGAGLLWTIWQAAALPGQPPERRR